MKKIIAVMLLIELVSFCQSASAEFVSFDTTDYYTGYVAVYERSAIDGTITETFNVGAPGGSYSFDGAFNVNCFGLSIVVKPTIEIPTVEPIQPNFLDPKIDWSFFENRKDFVFGLPANP